MNLYNPKNKNSVRNSLRDVFFNPFRIIAILIILGLLGVLIYLVSLGIVNNLFFSKNDLFVKRTSSSDKEFLLSKVTNLEELSTAEYIINKEIATTVDFNELELPGGINLERQKTQVAEISGSVKAGIDLGSIKSDDIKIEGNKITINIPSAKIISVDIDDEKTILKKDSNSLIVSIENLYPARKLEFENKIRSEIALEAKEQVTDAACSKGILEKSTENANEVIKKLYADSGFDAVEIINKNQEPCR